MNLTNEELINWQLGLLNVVDAPGERQTLQIGDVVSVRYTSSLDPITNLPEYEWRFDAEVQLYGDNIILLRQIDNGVNTCVSAVELYSEACFVNIRKYAGSQ